MGAISHEDMFDYVVRLYNHAHTTEMGTEEMTNASTNPFTFKDIEAGLQKMSNGKASDHMHMNAEFVKWTRD